MRRGEVYYIRLDPTEGSEQGGTRPAIIVSRDAINLSSPVVVVAPCTTYQGQRLYPSQVLLQPPEGGLTVRSVAMAEQIRTISTRRLGRLQGSLSRAALRQLERAMVHALDLPWPV
ncbi:MAG TPA: type II toxin-antitoxin system PemK/MazF family toxin [Dehalococcoidia bacterium]|nr:type II toxin-antitoxin system PemK/MazF family toxin [Dehalococcoidia bacterium]